jgi:hypothetical protein
MAHFPLIRHGPLGKLRVQKFFYRRLCIRCRENVPSSHCLTETGGYIINTHIHRDYKMISQAYFYFYKMGEVAILYAPCCVIIM